MYGKQADLRIQKTPGIKRLSALSRTYRVEALLGSGGSGTVYKAWHARLRKYVVIKEAGNCSPGVHEARRNEVEALKNIKNARIPQIYDFLVERNSCFTVMEYIEGESFDKLLEQGKQFKESRIIEWYGRLASILEAIHRCGVFHRDIKPANIILTPDEDVCLIDFNAAFVSGNGSRVISRSLGYASPEQLEYYRLLSDTCTGEIKARSNNAETELQAFDCLTEVTAQVGSPCDTVTGYVDWARSDIYSLGATMCHLLTGLHPRTRPGDILPIAEPGRYSADIVNIIERSTRLSPIERFTTAKELGEVIDSILLSPATCRQITS
jgi:serine/threonine protein kinase